MIKWVEICLQDWSRWHCKHIEASRLGYPSDTPESRALEGRGSGRGAAIVPLVIMPAQVKMTDRIIREMPKKWHRLVFFHYVHRHKIRQKREHYRQVDNMQNWFEGAYHVLSAHYDNNQDRM